WNFPARRAAVLPSKWRWSFASAVEAAASTTPCVSLKKSVRATSESRSLSPIGKKAAWRRRSMKCPSQSRKRPRRRRRNNERSGERANLLHTVGSLMSQAQTIDRLPGVPPQKRRRRWHIWVGVPLLLFVLWLTVLYLFFVYFTDRDLREAMA